VHSQPFDPYLEAARVRPLPAYVVDPRTCLRERGFAFVPKFGKEFAREYVRIMGGYLHSRLSSELKQQIAGDVRQYFMPHVEECTEEEEEDSEAEDPVASGNKRRRQGGHPTRKKKTRTKLNEAADAWKALKLKWHALVKRLALYLGFNELQLVDYHVQDEKLLIAKFRKGEQAPHFDRDDTADRIRRVYTVILYMSEGANSTAFPMYKLADFALPDFLHKDSNQVRNGQAMRETVERGHLESDRFARWPVHFGDMAFFTQATMHFGTENNSAADRMALFSVYTPFDEE